MLADLVVGWWCRSADGEQDKVELIQLDAEPDQHGSHVHFISSPDPFDLTTHPRGKNLMPTGPKQRDLKERLDLPVLAEYPVPPRCNPDEPYEVRWRLLLQAYQDFAIDLHTGIYLTQLFSDTGYLKVHCQLMEDLETLKLDQSNGRIIEFPLSSVSRVYRAVQDETRRWPEGLTSVGLDHVVVIEFMRRRLAFVFKESAEAQHFIMCLELLIRRAQQHRKRAKEEAELARTKGLPRACLGSGNPVENEPPEWLGSPALGCQGRACKDVPAATACGSTGRFTANTWCVSRDAPEAFGDDAEFIQGRLRAV